jgi:hypothetical protein
MILMNQPDTTASAEPEAISEIYLRPFVRANESRIRYYIGSLIHQRMIEAIGEENLDKVRLYFQGSTLDDPIVLVEGPADLRAKIEEALREPVRP